MRPARCAARRESRSHSGNRPARSDATSSRAARDAPSGPTPQRLASTSSASQVRDDVGRAMLRALGLAVGKHEATLWRNDGNFRSGASLTHATQCQSGALELWGVPSRVSVVPRGRQSCPRNTTGRRHLQDIHVVRGAAATTSGDNVASRVHSWSRAVGAKEWLRSAAKRCFFSWPKADPNYEEFRLTRFAASHFADAYRLFYAGWTISLRLSTALPSSSTSTGGRIAATSRRRGTRSPLP